MDTFPHRLRWWMAPLAAAAVMLILGLISALRSVPLAREDRVAPLPGGQTVAACLAQARDGDPTSLGELASASGNVHLPEPTRRAAADALLEIGLDAVPQLVLHDVNNQTTAAILEILCRLGQPESRSALETWHEAAQELDAWARNPAYWPRDTWGDFVGRRFGVPASSGPSPYERPEYLRAVAQLQPCLEHADPVVVLAAAALLDRYEGLAGPDGAGIQALLASSAPSVRECAIRTLYKDRHAEQRWERDLLLPALDDAGVHVRTAAALVLGRDLHRRTMSSQQAATPQLVEQYGGARLIDRLGAALGAGRKLDRAAAARWLGELGPHATPALPQLRRALSHPDRQLQLDAAMALARIAPEDATAMPQILAWLDLAPIERTPVEGGYREVNQTHVVTSAITCLSLRGLHAATAVSRLVQLLDSTPEANLQRSLCHALPNLGPEARAALPALRRMEPGVSDISLRKLVRNTIEQLERMEPAQAP